MEEKKLTGYPSIDKPWLKYYKDNAEQYVANISNQGAFLHNSKHKGMNRPDEVD